jgi:putative membrane protein
MFDVFLKQASSVQVQNRKSIVIPGCEIDNLEKIKSYYFNEYEWQDLSKFAIHKKYIIRRFLYGGLIPFAIMALGLYFAFGFYYSLIALAWLPLQYYMSVVRFRKWQIQINDHILYVKSGLFGNYNKTIRLYKIQDISLDQGIYHRLNDLCNLTIHTASGKISIPFLTLETGRAMIDFLLYKVEVDTRSWM